MSEPAIELAPVDVDEEERPPSAWRTIARSIEGRIGVALGAVMLAIIAFGRFFTPYPPNEIGVGPPASRPSSEHLLGTDALGRDVLSRFLVGGDTVLLVPLAAVALAFAAGGGLGMIGGYLRGTPDTVIARGFDVLLTIPPLLIVLVIISGLGSSWLVLIVTVALVFLPRIGRVTRGSTQAVATEDYVAAAQARGERTGAIVIRELLPNIASPVIADLALRITYAIIFVATLNFLGLGAQPPSSDWGLMVAEGRRILTVQPWSTLAPAFGIAALAVSFNLIADALTRHLAPEMTAEAVQL